MQQFTVPQFIDVENKIIGPLTTRQFLIILAAGIVGAIAYRLFDFTLFLTIGAIIALLTVTFAFVRINGRPFHFFVLNLIQTLRRPGARVWQKNPIAPLENLERTFTKPEVKTVTKDFYRKSRLAELSLIVDTQGRYRGE